MTSDKAMVIFQPSGHRGQVPLGVSLLEAARLLGVDIEAICGEKKRCGKCILRIEEGSFQHYDITSSMDNASEWQEEEGAFISPERREKGLRLGCVARVKGDLMVFVPKASRTGKQLVTKAARDIDIEFDPAVRLYYIELDPPTLEDPTGDFERICRTLAQCYGLADLVVDIHALRMLPDALREGKWKVTVSIWNNREVIRVRPGKKAHAYGMAIDVGTTTVAAYLCDLTTMHVINTVSMMNPQCKYGEDVMARITYHMVTPDGLNRMREEIITGLNDLIDKAVAKTHPPGEKAASTQGGGGADASVDAAEEEKTYLRLAHEDIEDVAIGFNTVMHHIFLGLNPEYVGMAPFPPVILQSMDIKARDLDVHISPAAYMFILPNEAGFVGADNVGVLIAEEPYKHVQHQLIIDIGTNGELVLGNRNKLLCCSCATGPALEGAQLSFGMRAAPGAIERIEIDPETKSVNYKVIGRDAWRMDSRPKDMKAMGICGSGVLDVLAELYISNVISKSGAFNKSVLKGCDRFRENPDTRQPEFVVAWAEETLIEEDIVITQKDIRQIQLAKAALYAGCKLMLKHMELDKVDVVKIAGAFGTQVAHTKALIVGLFPDCPIEEIRSVGNAAGDGCRAALLNVKKRAEADWCSRNVEYIELTSEPTFQQDFMEAMHLPHMTDAFPHLKGIVPDEILDQ